MKLLYNLAGRPTEGVEIQLYCFFNIGARWGGRLTPRPGGFTPGNEPVPIVLGAGWALGEIWTGVGSTPSNEIRSPDRSARRKSLYRLCYPAHITKTYCPQLESVKMRALTLSLPN
jgi:hypothetical protein